MKGIKSMMKEKQAPEKYVKWEHVQELIELFECRDECDEWDSSYDEYDRKIKKTIEWLKRNAKEMNHIDELKLYQCSATAIDHDIWDCVIARTEEEAEKKFKKKLDEEDIWYAGTVLAYEVKIDGYEIHVVPK
jgi:hypothetical protein